MRTVETLNEKQKEFYNLLPAKMKEAFLGSLPDLPESRSKQRRERSDINGDIVLDMANAITAWLKLYNSLEGKEITAEDYKMLSKMPLSSQGYTITKKPGRKGQGENAGETQEKGE